MDEEISLYPHLFGLEALHICLMIFEVHISFTIVAVREVANPQHTTTHRSDKKKKKKKKLQLGGS
jgi:hypothetical protein